MVITTIGPSLQSILWKILIFFIIEGRDTVEGVP